MKVVYLGSTIMINNSVFMVSGNYFPYAIERLDFEGDEIFYHQVIGYTFDSSYPVLYEAPVDYCV